MEEAHVAAAMAKYGPIAVDKPGGPTWLQARWDPGLFKVAFGCIHCHSLLTAGLLKLPARYADPSKSCSFAHFNLHLDVKKCIENHPKTGVHKEAKKLLGETAGCETEDAKAKCTWMNTTRLALRSFLRLKPAENFMQALRDATSVGGDVYGTAHVSSFFYNERLEAFDLLERKQLQSELAASPFKEIFTSADFKENVGAIRFYFFDEQVKLTSRVALIRKFHQVNHATVMGFIREATAGVLKSMEDHASLVVDGCTVDGVMPEQGGTLDNVWSKLLEEAPDCMRFCCTAHKEDLVLKDVRKDDICKEALKDLQSFKAKSTWIALRHLIDAKVFMQPGLAAASLATLAVALGKAPITLLEEWHHLQAKVAARLKEGISDSAFRSELGQALAEVSADARRALHKSLVTGLLTLSNATQFERDLKSLRELWLKRSKTLAHDKLAMQLRLHLNSQCRSGAEQCEGRLLAQAWQQSQQENHRLRQSLTRTRWDSGGTHQKKRCIREGHLTKNDAHARGDRLVSAANGLQDELGDWN